MIKTASTVIRIVILLTSVLACSGNLNAQGRCIPKPLTVHAVTGRVLFEAAGVTEPLSDAIVEIAPYGYQKPALSKVVTTFDGRFKLSTAAPGRYYLSTQHPAIIGMTVEIRIQPPKKKGLSTTQDIEF